MLDNDEALSEGFMAGVQAVLLAKFDPQGNLLWKKSIKHSLYDSYTNWMDIVGDTAIVLLAQSYAPGPDRTQKIWYLDTLITGRHIDPPTYPSPGGDFACFVTFDLDGNKQSEYFLRRRYFTTSEFVYPVSQGIGGIFLSPFHVDNNGNVYIFTNIGMPTSNADTMRIVVNEQKIYPLEDSIFTNNTWLLKFTPDFDLIWSKPMMKDTSGVGNEGSSTARFNPYPTGITVDEDENLYLTGHINSWHSNDSLYYREIDLGSEQKLIINDASCGDLGFIIKYDTTGEPIWANQVFGEKRPDLPPSPAYGSYISSSQINNDNDYVYIFGWAFNNVSGRVENEHSIIDTTVSKLYFDDGTPLKFNIQSRGGHNALGIFFAKLNKETGRYISHGTSDGTSLDRYKDRSFVVRNNQVIRSNHYKLNLQGIDTVYSADQGFALVRWKDDGELIEVKYIISYFDNKPYEDGNTIMNDNGDLFITGIFFDNISFGDIELNRSSRSNAFMAKYTDTTFLHPYDNSSIEDVSIENNNDLLIYPNPAQNEVSIKAQGERILNYSLYNINGQLIFRKDSPKAKIESLSLFLLPKGVYILKVITNKNVYTRKVVRG